jgi:DnaA family protein
MKQLALDLSASAQPTLDNFVAGRNEELAQALRHLAAGDARERFVYLWGEPGCGRSHLLRSAIAALLARGAAAVYVAVGPGVAIPGEAERAHCVALDDVERLDPGAQVAAFHLYNALRERGGALIAAGCAPPVQLPLRGDLVTRFAWGLVYQVMPLTDEDKARALADRAAARGFRLPPEVGDFLLSRGRRDMPSLIALVDALDRYSLETKRPVTVAMARELLTLKGDAEPAIRGAGAGGAA